jgi:hypothetical protein
MGTAVTIRVSPWEAAAGLGVTTANQEIITIRTTGHSRFILFSCMCFSPKLFLNLYPKKAKQQIGLKNSNAHHAVIFSSEANRLQAMSNW